MEDRRYGAGTIACRLRSVSQTVRYGGEQDSSRFIVICMERDFVPSLGNHGGRSRWGPGVIVPPPLAPASEFLGSHRRWRLEAARHVFQS